MHLHRNQASNCKGSQSSQQKIILKTYVICTEELIIKILFQKGIASEGDGIDGGGG